MSDQYRTVPVTAAPYLREFATEPDNHRRQAANSYAKQAARPKLEPADVAEFLGVPASEISVAIQEALVPLLHEFERLREAEAVSTRRILYLEDAADRHPFLKCLNRRSFLRDLDVFLQGGNVDGTLAVMHVSGVEIRRDRLGLTAAEHATAAILDVITAQLEPADLVGCLGGTDFAILFPAQDKDLVKKRLQPVLAQLTEQGFGPSLGLVTAQPMADAMTLIKDADQVRNA